MSRWSAIPGWFDWAEVYRDVVADAAPGSTLVECGVFLGRSTAFLAEIAAAAKKDLRIVAYDLWCISRDEAGETMCRRLDEAVAVYGSQEAAARANLEPYADILTVVTADALQAYSRHPINSVAMVWLDDCHETDHVLREMQAWWSRVQPGGLMGGHDFDWPSVHEAVITFAAKRNVPVAHAWPRSWVILKP